MKKLISLILSIVMIVLTGTFIIWAISDTASLPQGAVFYENDFNDTSLSGKTDSALADAIGWSWKEGYDTYVDTPYVNGTKKAQYDETVLSVENGGLKINNTANVGNSVAGRIEFLVANHASISDGVVVEYDFHYTDQIIGLTDAGLPAHFSSGNVTTDLTTNSWANSWHVMPRLDGTVRNSAQISSSWLSGTNQSSFLSGTGTTTTGSFTSGSKTYKYINGTEYSVRITACLENGVRVYLKKASDPVSEYREYAVWQGEWLNNVQTNCPQMFNDYLRFMVGPGCEVVIDNLRISALDFYPQFAAYQEVAGESEGSVALQLIAAMADYGYSSLGYTVKTSYVDAEGNTQTGEQILSCTNTYETISYLENGVTVNKSAQQFNSGTSKLYAITLTGIPQGVDVTYEVTPYMVDQSSVTHQGDSVTFTYNTELKAVPAYVGGKLQSTELFTDGMYRRYITNTSSQEYGAYRSLLTTSGYTLYSENQIGSNLYATYKKGDLTVHVYYMAAQSAVRILIAPAGRAINYPLTSVSDGEVATPSLTLMSIDYEAQVLNGFNGESFVYTMADGSYVIIDGGWGYDAAELYRFLRANNRRADGEILIRAWIITHPHEDHYGAFERFSTLYASSVELEYFVAQFDVHASSLAPNDVTRIMTAFARFEGAEHIIPMAGQKMFFGEAQVEFFYTYEMLYPVRTTDGNEMSLVMMIEFEGSTSLITGDALGKTVNYLTTNYGSELKCDFLQIPHHASESGTQAFYNATDPDYIFVNTSFEKYEERKVLTTAALPYLLNTMGVTRVFVADGPHQTLTFPYIPPSFELGTYETDKDRVSFDIFQ